LQALRDGEGMLFPFEAPRPATFHMGRVAFPIDLAFIGPDRRIVKIVRNAAPGFDTHWSHPRVAGVLEVSAGGLLDIEIGDAADAALEPAELARFIDRSPPPDGDPNATDGPMPNYRSQWGNDPKTPSDIVDVDPEAPALRQGQSLALGPSDQISVATSVARGIPIQWTPDRLNGGATTQAQITPSAIYQFVAPAIQSEEEQAAIRALVVSPTFLELLGDALILANRIDLARVGAQGLSVWKGNKS